MENLGSEEINQENQVSESEPHSKVVHDNFVECYSKLADAIGSEYLEPLRQFIQADDKVIEIEATASNVRTRFYELLKDELDDMWNTFDVSKNLDELDSLKKSFPEDTPGWRPSGKTPNEQISAYRLRILKKQLEFYKERIEEQNTEMNTLKQEIIGKREAIKSNMQSNDLDMGRITSLIDGMGNAKNKLCQQIKEIQDNFLL